MELFGGNIHETRCQTSRPVRRDPKEKNSCRRPEAKKAKSNKLASKEIVRPEAPREGTSTKPDDVLGPRASMLGSPSMVEKDSGGGDSSCRQGEKVDKLFLDQQAVVFRSSLTVRSRDIGNDATFQIAQAKSAEMEMAQAQNRTIELEGLLAEFGEREQKATEEFKEKTEAVARLEAEVVELKKNEALSKRKATEEFKSSDDFQ
ncbi:hypothetical protein Acr_00g0077500 [Actinidia rufa]|uniref:Uncharacterized protein n=1 Tax=Actinidia rufa TaxID=165716 RepID=A0A7J0DTA1_9ERIC|nr:hypothetical protein Acr_00g0077500 [Actinidia rufa]